MELRTKADVSTSALRVQNMSDVHCTYVVLHGYLLHVYCTIIYGQSAIS